MRIFIKVLEVLGFVGAINAFTMPDLKLGISFLIFAILADIAQQIRRK